MITGASAGIGAELASVFASHGHELVLVARRGVQLDAIAAEIASIGGPRPHVMPADLTDADAIDTIVRELSARGLEPNFVVNNAGFGLLGDAAELDRAEQLAMIDLNVRVLTDLSLRFIESVAQHRGGILNVASLASFMPGPGMAVYYATKAYVLSFSEALHHELRPRGVRVTALCPGPVSTGFQARAGLPKGYFPAVLGRPIERIAREGYDGLMRGRRVVLTGKYNRGLSVLTRLTPRGVVLAAMNRVRQRRDL